PLLMQFNNFSEKELGISVNLTGIFLGTKHAARAMMPSRSGSIINVGSVSSSVGGVASHAYTNSKHAVMGLTRNVATELERYGIRVNCVSPHFILAPLTKEFFKIDESAGVRVYSNLDGGESTEEDVAKADVYLGSDESKNMANELRLPIIDEIRKHLGIPSDWRESKKEMFA
ncbi:secoisolariciresinol dehydrogenase-like, partial [Eucalyptus grandis]|uniref:secoisolariciresinol dehydrogenase-like n=1 Tax=Eucalyptus grandis TaxID=71139 RepID=UPI00192EEAB1